MAAIDVRSSIAAERAGTIIAAALALPGVMAHADSAPEHGEVAVKYLQYRDWQPGLDRIKVRSPSLYVLAPLTPQWALEGSLVADSVSGATPRYHTAISGATPRMTEERHAGDIRMVRYENRSTYSLGLSTSSEHDYDSNALSASASFSSDDNNRTFNVGIGFASDKISSVNDTTLHEHRRTTEMIVGVTQAWTPNDLVQLELTGNFGRGFYSDPYKEPDARPRRRDQGIALLRWNHHVEGLGATLRMSYRYYQDTFSIRAHTVGAEWVQPIGTRLAVTPLVRLYTQSAASFYFDPVYDPNVGAPYPPGYFTNPPTYISADQRLAAFGAVTVGLKLAFQWTPDWSTDFKAERYEQRSQWRVGGTGSPGLDPFRANFFQLGVSRRF